MRGFRGTLAALALLFPCYSARAGVVINEIFYHAPNDLDDLEWIELHNPDAEPVDLGNWKLAQGAKFTFPAGTTVAANGYLVVACNPERFRQYYRTTAIGPLAAPLKNSGAKIDLVNAGGQVVDSVRYKDGGPWPLSADGQTASLERISPASAGDDAENWAPSPLTADETVPGGTPGAKNAAFSANLPPVVSKPACSPPEPGVDDTLHISAIVRDADGVKDVTLLYRVMAPGIEGQELALPMTRMEGGDRYAATLPGQKANRLVRYRIKATDAKGTVRLYPHPEDLRPALSVWVRESYKPGQIPWIYVLRFRDTSKPPAPRAGGWSSLFGGRSNEEDGRRGNRFGPPVALAPRGSSAMVYIDQKTGKPALFDFVQITERVGAGGGGGGYKIRLHSGQSLHAMTTLNLVFEGNERFLLAEALTYELFRKAGSPAPTTEFARVWVDGRLKGYHLLVEQPNKAFLRRNRMRDDGNMYKVVWFGRGIVGQHEKKTNVQAGHDDLVEVIQKLQQTSGDAQWQVIQQNFDVPQFATYYAINLCVSDWDGYFNNHFVYHDVNGSRKWHIFPWDRDKTWGFHDGLGDGQIFFDMPLTFGMAGDTAPGGGRGWFGGSWWRPGGYFSSPLLANPQFRKAYLTRVRQVLETIYTPEVCNPMIDELAQRLREEFTIRGENSSGGPEAAAERVRVNLQSFREHVAKRREFLLGQAELRNLAAAESAPATSAGR